MNNNDGKEVNKVNKRAAINKSLLLTIAKEIGTPTYVYDKETIIEQFSDYKKAFANRKHLICYAVKANGNLSILHLLDQLGAGFDIVSMGELQRVIMAGAETDKVIFSGVGKSIEEIAFAIQVGIAAFDIESLSELKQIIAVAEEMEEIAPISVRFNPDVDAKTHPYISTGLKNNKFGLAEEQAFKAYELALKSQWIKIVGINMHIGSQINDISVLKEALQKQSEFIKRLKAELDITLKHINIGGGLGIAYDNDYAELSKKLWIDEVSKIYPDNKITLVIEPGRTIIAKAGMLLTEVLHVKSETENKFAIVDAAMNDYMRVALYQAHNDIINISGLDVEPDAKREINNYNIVGPVCESTDCFAKDRTIAIQQGDVLALADVGAYGFSMASNYNARCRPAEVLLDSKLPKGYIVIRERETFEQLVAGELLPVDVENDSGDIKQ